MAVQAQSPSNAFYPNFKINIREHEHLGLVISDPDENLKFNAYGSRKRNRDTEATMIQPFQVSVSPKIPKTMPMMLNNQEAPHHPHDRIMGSADTSTRGRPLQCNMGIDAFIRFHNTKLGSDLRKIQTNHYNQLLQIVENQASKRIIEKDSELASLKGKQTELEKLLNQIMMENRFWQVATENSEAAISTLKASLKCQAAVTNAADGESCCYGGDTEDNHRRLACKVCGERDVSVLVLPCRHLCLCAGCEQGAETCPICYGAKSVGMQVFLD